MWSRSCECRIRIFQRHACLARQPWVHAACQAAAVREGHTEWPPRRAPAAAVKPEPDQAHVEVVPNTPVSPPPSLVCWMREDVSPGFPPAQSPAAGRPQAREATGYAAQAAAAAGGVPHGLLSSQWHAPEGPHSGPVPARPAAQTLLQTLYLPLGERSGGGAPHAHPVPLPAMPGTPLQPRVGLLGVAPGSALGAPMVRPPPACTGKDILLAVLSSFVLKCKNKPSLGLLIHLLNYSFSDYNHCVLVVLALFQQALAVLWQSTMVL